MQGVKAWAFRIFLQPTPISALERFLGIRRPRGKRAKNTERDFWVAVTVFDKMKSGMTLEDASYAVAESCGLEGDNVKKIYSRNHREAKAHVAMVALDKKLRSGKERSLAKSSPRPSSGDVYSREYPSVTALAHAAICTRMIPVARGCGDDPQYT